MAGSRIPQLIIFLDHNPFSRPRALEDVRILLVFEISECWEICCGLYINFIKAKDRFTKTLFIYGKMIAWLQLLYIWFTMSKAGVTSFLVWLTSQAIYYSVGSREFSILAC